MSEWLSVWLDGNPVTILIGLIVLGSAAAGASRGGRTRRPGTCFG